MTDIDDPSTNPDCQGGKHQACSGGGWDMSADRPCACRCECHVQATLDPRPWVWPSGTRSMFSHGDDEPLTFAPRPEFEQSWDAYTPFLRALGDPS